MFTDLPERSFDQNRSTHDHRILRSSESLLLSRTSLFKVIIRFFFNCLPVQTFSFVGPKRQLNLSDYFSSHTFPVMQRILLIFCFFFLNRNSSILQSCWSASFSRTHQPQVLFFICLIPLLSASFAKSLSYTNINTAASVVKQWSENRHRRTQIYSRRQGATQRSCTWKHVDG